MTLNDTQWLQVENTSKCNAWCPACARNQSGFELKPDLEIQDLSTKRFQDILERLPNLQVIQFCGTFGDTMAAHNVIEHLLLAKRHAKKLQIHTHGALRSPKWWTALYDVLKDVEHDIWFGLDGLKGVHEIHRQGTDFDRAIQNASAFIDAGGHATWQFIPFAHNEHQIKDCIQLSQQLGFKKFKLVTSVRENFNARHWKSGAPIEFKPWSRSHITNPYTIVKERNILETVHCRHLVSKSLYLNANGNVSHCCYLNHQRQYAELDLLDDIEREISTAPDSKCLEFCGNGVRIQQI